METMETKQQMYRTALKVTYKALRVIMTSLRHHTDVTYRKIQHRRYQKQQLLRQRHAPPQVSANRW